ncbi:hypothetical protein ARMGADRAFT_1079595 [Armillaria gallica]|uniref:Endonuclease/exonuclease/phosphatase domain-containing protein n=1 Tax=Armillaria gallica TaxID=47427 RepID=A0A2H3DFW5_ARMGA|nr:hypothetical protein ARMGADRAFT_1079595 [Armillaria gallica]
MAWNIHGELSLMLRGPDIELIYDYDLILLQETWLSREEHYTLPIPDGYSIVSLPRLESLMMEGACGGVAVIYRKDVPMTVCHELSCSECMVLDFEDLTIILSYLPPWASRWLDCLEVHPHDFLEGVIAVRSLLNKLILVLGDENCCTGELTSINEIPRELLDLVTDASGKWFVDLCKDHSLLILNGTLYDRDLPGVWTDFQYNGCSVVDYACASISLLPHLLEFKVVDWPTRSDHAFLSVKIQSTAMAQVVRKPPKKYWEQ